MTSKRPRIEGYAIVSREGMIAKSDGSFPEDLKIPADQKFYQEALERASAVANGRHSSEGGPREKARKRILLTRRVQRLIVDPESPNVVQWNPGTASFEEAWRWRSYSSSTDWCCVTRACLIRRARRSYRNGGRRPRTRRPARHARPPARSRADGLKARRSCG